MLKTEAVFQDLVAANDTILHTGLLAKTAQVPSLWVCKQAGASESILHSNRSRHVLNLSTNGHQYSISWCHSGSQPITSGMLDHALLHG